MSLWANAVQVPARCNVLWLICLTNPNANGKDRHHSATNSYT